MTNDTAPTRLAAFCGLLILALLLTGCNLPSSSAAAPVPPQASQPPVPAATETEAGCPSSSLIPPDVVASESPISESLRPTFEWSYAGDCPPDEFRIEASPDGDFNGPTSVAGTAPAGAVSWTPNQDLSSVTHYAWRVAAASAGVIGAYSLPQDFWTGPPCAGADMHPPQLVSPADGAYVDDPSPRLDFDYPAGDCLQEWYSLDVASDPGFDTTTVHATVGPSTEFDADLDYLEDCTLYYWRAKAVFGMDISGPYSNVSAFYTDFSGSCAPHTGLPRIAGYVWADHCEAATPANCVWQEGGLAPDGIRQDAEPAMPGLLVRIAPGLCTSPDMGWTTGPTDEEGRYSQVVLPDTYCVWIFRDRDGNQDILGSGRWTHPPGGYDFPVRYEIELDWGEERLDLDFAWGAD